MCNVSTQTTNCGNPMTTNLQWNSRFHSPLNTLHIYGAQCNCILQTPYAHNTHAHTHTHTHTHTHITIFSKHPPLPSLPFSLPHAFHPLQPRPSPIHPPQPRPLPSTHLSPGPSYPSTSAQAPPIHPPQPRPLPHPPTSAQAFSTARLSMVATASP